MSNIITKYRNWMARSKAEMQTEMESIIDEIIKNGELISAISYNRYGDDVEYLWHIDFYVCRGQLYQIEYTDYVYVDLKFIGINGRKDI